MTAAQKARIENEWSRIAGEGVTVEDVAGVVYGFTSEIGALRLYHKFHGDGRAAYSENLQRWYFTTS